MRKLKDEIVEIARPLVEARGAFLIDVSVHGERGGRAIEIFLDTDEGVTTQLCADVSRDLGSALDRTNMLNGRYNLVVSSPGTDRPLIFARQYPKNKGRTFVVKYRTSTGIERIEGKLIEAHPERIVLQVGDNESRTLLFDEILDARVKPLW